MSRLLVTDVRMIQFEMDGTVFVLHVRERNIENTGHKCVVCSHSFRRQNFLSVRIIFNYVPV